jgi:phosphoribosylanthranilate isomerase
LAKLFFLFDIWRMSLKVKVKVGHITHLSDARYCAGMGVQLLGFPVGNNGLAPATYRQIIDWVSGPEFVLELSATEDFEQVKSNYPGHLVQIQKENLSLLNDRTIHFIVSIKASDWSSLAEQLMRHQHIQYLEVSGSANEWKLIQEINSHFPVLLKMNDAVELDHFLAAGISGFALEGGHEERPGLRDYSSLSDVLEKLED